MHTRVPGHTKPRPPTDVFLLACATLAGMILWDAGAAAPAGHPRPSPQRGSNSVGKPPIACPDPEC